MAETHLLMNATEQLAERLNKIMAAEEGAGETGIEIDFKKGKGRGGELREGTLRIQGQKYTFDVKDLPCIMECNKALDDMIYKTGDIAQILQVRPNTAQPSPSPSPPDTPATANSEPMEMDDSDSLRGAAAAATAAAERLGTALEKRINDPMLENSGITPPTRHIRLDRFRYPPVSKKKVEKAVELLQHMISGKPMVQRELVEVAVDRSEAESALFRKAIFMRRGKKGNVIVSRRLTPRIRPVSSSTPSRAQLGGTPSREPTPIAEA
eukprot:CAMPEP_0197520594 /NCGR_PEP_ID=MMETSP1318-20131121/5940_1 /TAXON_ID=552666 /ORGANISM="Partenskyella glossopodia, Strain RCC365" /LENGTH=266 /DNA_ID=CAMNT_0043072249 /DNA_START=257 /DNA_END=1054 /DNA_ORIENTATION=-